MSLPIIVLFMLMYITGNDILCTAELSMNKEIQVNRLPQNRRSPEESEFRLFWGNLFFMYLLFNV